MPSLRLQNTTALERIHQLQTGDTPSPLLLCSSPNQPYKTRPMFRL